jgi:hypothetical protein
VLARIVHRLARPYPLEHLQPFHQPPHAILRLESQREVLGIAISQPQPDDQAAVSDDVQGGELLLGQLDGMVERQEDDAGPERHALGLGGHAGQSGDGLEIGEGIRE